LSERVAVVGGGHAGFAKRADVTIGEWTHEAVVPALEDAGLATAEVDALVVGVAGDVFAARASPAALVQDYVGVGNKSSFRVEAACATGGAAVHMGWSNMRGWQFWFLLYLFEEFLCFCFCCVSWVV